MSLGQFTPHPAMALDVAEGTAVGRCPACGEEVRMNLETEEGMCIGCGATYTVNFVAVLKRKQGS